MNLLMLMDLMQIGLIVGFAYALGIVDILKQSGVPLGRFYIFAPENACSGEVDVSEEAFYIVTK